jgi:hypothetical protein
VEHPSLAKLEGGGTGGEAGGEGGVKGETTFLCDLAEKVYVPDKMSLKMNEVECHSGQPLGVFQISRLFQITRLYLTSVLDRRRSGFRSLFLELLCSSVMGDVAF